MRRLPPRSAVALLAGALWALAIPSTADAVLGDGIPVGPTRLHLGVETDLTYTSEAGAGAFGADDTLVNPGDLIATFRALIGLEGKSDTFKLKLTGDVDWNQYLGVVAPGTQGLSFLGSNVQGTLQAYPDGKVGVDITESFSRSNLTSNPVFGIGVLTLLDDTKLRLRFRPGGGAIEFGITGDVGVALYSPQINDGGGGSATTYPQCATGSVGSSSVPTPGCDPGLAAAYNSWYVVGALDARWRFLPKTGITLDANIGTLQYVYGPTSESYADVPNLNAMPYEVLLGFGTLLSTRFSFTIKAGYQGITFPSQVTSNAGTVAGLADVGFRFSESASTRLGFTRTITPVGGEELWYIDNRIFWDLTLAPTPKVTLIGGAAVDFIGFGGQEGRIDTAYGVNARIDYAFLKWLKLVGRVDVAARTTNSNADVNDSAYSYTFVDASIGLAALF